MFLGWFEWWCYVPWFFAPLVVVPSSQGAVLVLDWNSCGTLMVIPMVLLCCFCGPGALVVVPEVLRGNSYCRLAVLFWRSSGTSSGVLVALCGNSSGALAVLPQILRWCEKARTGHS